MIPPHEIQTDPKITGRKTGTLDEAGNGGGNGLLTSTNQIIAFTSSLMGSVFGSNPPPGYQLAGHTGVRCSGSSVTPPPYPRPTSTPPPHIKSVRRKLVRVAVSTRNPRKARP